LKRKEDERRAAMLEAARLAQAAPESIVGTSPEVKTFQKLVAAGAAPAPQASAGVSARDRFTFIVENPALVPREFLMVDERKISAHVAVHGLQSNIPGVRVDSEAQIVVRRSSGVV